MNALRIAIAVAVPAIAAAQTAPRQLTLVPDGRIDISRAGGIREVSLVPGPDGRVLLVPRGGGRSEMTAYDSAGAKLPWRVITGRNDSAEIMFPQKVGWVGNTTSVWVGDPGHKQVALLDESGAVTKSIEQPSWVHPKWAERRAFPLFASMDPVAVYPDQTMLIWPLRERSLIKTPTYDRSVAHLLRVTWDGAIQRTIATLPPSAEDRIDFRGRGGGGHTLVVPFAPKTMWAVSSDGLRIVIASPGVSLADSGTIRVIALNDRGDTVFSRRYPSPVVRIPQASIDQFKNNIRAVGALSADAVRDSASKRIPVFQSFLTGVMVGHDHSTWLILRPASDTAKGRRAMVIDPRGDIVGIVGFPPDQTPAAVALHHVWTFEIGRMRTPTGILKYAVKPTSSR